MKWLPIDTEKSNNIKQESVLLSNVSKVESRRADLVKKLEKAAVGRRASFALKLALIVILSTRLLTLLA